jgi:hypothetical protein
MGHVHRHHPSVPDPAWDMPAHAIKQKKRNLSLKQSTTNTASQSAIAIAIAEARI